MPSCVRIGPEFLLSVKMDVIQHAELLPRRVKHHGKPEHIVQIHLVLIKFRQRGFGNEKRLPAQEFGGRAIGGLDKPDQWRPLVHTDGVDLHLSGRFVPSLKIHHIPAQELQRVGIVIDADFATDAVGTGRACLFRPDRPGCCAVPPRTTPRFPA